MDWTEQLEGYADELTEEQSVGMNPKSLEDFPQLSAKPTTKGSTGHRNLNHAGYTDCAPQPRSAPSSGSPSTMDPDPDPAPDTVPPISNPTLVVLQTAHIV